MKGDQEYDRKLLEVCEEVDGRVAAENRDVEVPRDLFDMMANICFAHWGIQMEKRAPVAKEHPYMREVAVSTAEPLVKRTDGRVSAKHPNTQQSSKDFTAGLSPREIGGRNLCSACGAEGDAPCKTPSGRKLAKPHRERMGL